MRCQLALQFADLTQNHSQVNLRRPIVNITAAVNELGGTDEIVDELRHAAHGASDSMCPFGHFRSRQALLHRDHPLRMSIDLRQQSAQFMGCHGHEVLLLQDHTPLLQDPELAA
jgi:hypothetical protein